MLPSTTAILLSTTISLLSTQHYQVSAQRLITQNQFTPQNQYQVNNNRISSNNQLVPQNSAQPRPNHYHTQPSYLTMPEEQDFHHIALLKGRAAAQQQNPSYNYTTILPARIAENTNLSDIFPFEFKANESSFLLSNAAANEQKAITAMYTEAKVEEKTIRLILSIIVTADGMKKTPVGEINNFLFTLNGITIPVKVLVIDAPQYQALVRNDWLQKANAKLDWEIQELQISYQGQHAQVPATCGTFNKYSEKALAFEFELEEKKPIIKTFMALGSTSNWAKETEQEHFTPHSEPETPGWNIPYLKPKPRKQRPYIPLKCKDCHKKLSSMRACISPEEEYKSHTCYYCKGHLIKRSGKWNKTSCLTCGKQLPDKCDWIDIAFREKICDQTCQYALSIAEKVKRGTPFNIAYNSALNKLYHYSHDAEMIYELAMVLINRGTKKDVLQMKEAEYIKYSLELAGFDYKDKVEVILLPSKSDEYKIKFGELKAMEEIETTLIYFIKSQFALQLKYFNNNGQGIKPKKAHEIDAGYNLQYPRKDTLINLKIALEIPPGAMVQITSRLSLASKEINVRGGIIDAGYTGDITIMLQNETDKPFQIEHAEKIAQAIYLLLINISGLQLVSQREQLGKSERRTNSFVTISPFGEHLEIYTCLKPTTTQQIFEFNEQKEQRNNIFQQELPQTVLNFSEIIEHSLPKINPNPSSKNYHVNQLKKLIAEFADIFAENNNDLGRTNLVQHQIYTGDAKPRQQQAY
ncbi:hypothetical protein G9A89_023939 [Geosiphon pyriformis]|nr:hypothetical protein G9A89_023939 [Geosiphon pyriformis]